MTGSRMIRITHSWLDATVNVWIKECLYLNPQHVVAVEEFVPVPNSHGLDAKPENMCEVTVINGDRYYVHMSPDTFVMHLEFTLKGVA